MFFRSDATRTKLECDSQYDDVMGMTRVARWDELHTKELLLF